MKILSRWFYFLLMSFVSTTVYAGGPALVLKASWNTAIYRPTRIALCNDRKVAVADYHRRQVFLFADDHRLLSSIPVLQPPLSVAFASDGSMYVGISNDVLQINLSGTIEDRFSLHGVVLQSPVDVVVGGSGVVYVVDREGCKVIVCSSNGEQQFSFGSFGTNQGEFRSPVGVAIDEEAGEVIVADAGNSRVQIFSMDGKFHRMFGEHIKQTDSTWQIVGTFAHMQGVAVDAQHRIYVTDSGLDHVQIFDATGNHLGFLGKDGVRTAHFRVPMDVAISQTNKLFVASMASSEIKEYAIQSSTDVPPPSPEQPSVFALEQNFPNPFNPTTIIRFSLPEEGFVTLSVYDITGREVVTLFNEEARRGVHSVEWNGRDHAGNPVASGVYFSRLQVGNKYSQTNKIVFLK